MSGGDGIDAEKDSIDDDGFQTMTVSSRRRPKNNNNNNKTKSKNNGYHRQRRSENNHTGKRQNNKPFKKKVFSGGPSLSTRGWSKPSEGWDVAEASNEENEHSTTETTSARATATPPTKGAGATAPKPTRDDTIDKALGSSASTTTATTTTTTTTDTMSSLMSSIGFATTEPTIKPEPQSDSAAIRKNFMAFARGQKMEDLLGDLGEQDPHWKERQFPSFSEDGDREPSDPRVAAEEEKPTSFSAFCKGQSASELLADFGQADPNWKQKIVEEAEEEGTGSDFDQQQPGTSEPTQQQQRSSAKGSHGGSKLAPHGRAAIHLSIESFGFAHGAPSRGVRDRSGSPFTQPLEYLDVGDAITDPVPEHLEFHDGLRSGVIKRLLKTAPLNDLVLDGDDDDSDENSVVDIEKLTDFSAYCKWHLAETKIFPSLLEAIHEGGHGYVSPLTMRFSVGSSLGRHRSVVATEWIAQHLRHLLRSHNEKVANKKNENTISYNPKDSRPITCTVSVGTVHRDVNKRIPQKHYKEDDEDYVDKNDRL